MGVEGVSGEEGVAPADRISCSARCTGVSSFGSFFLNSATTPSPLVVWQTLAPSSRSSIEHTGFSTPSCVMHTNFLFLLVSDGGA